MDATTADGSLPPATFPKANPANNAPQQVSTAGVSLAVGEADHYTVVITFTVSPLVVDADLICVPATPNKGAYNTGSITGTTTASDTGCGDVPFQRENSLGVNKSDPTIAPTGTPNQYTATYQLTVVNIGQQTGAYTLSDTPGFPAGVTLNSLNVTTADGQLNGGISFPVASPANNTPIQIGATNVFLAGGTAHHYTVTITFTVTPQVAQGDLNCVLVTPNKGAFNSASITGSNNDSDSGCGNIPGFPSVVLAKTDGVTTVTPGGTTTYALTVVNTGATATSGTVTVVDVLPTGLTIAGGAVPLGGANAGSWSCSASGQVITCTSTTSIAANGGTSVFSFTVNVAPGLGDGTVLTNKAQVGGGGDPEETTPTSGTAGTCTAFNDPIKGCAVDTDTVFVPPPAANIPTMSEYALMLMTLLLAMAGGLQLRRRRTRR
jgi:uncharacterized repeat protein (TIGR01451 family)